MPATIYGPTPFILTTGDRIYQSSDSIGALDGDSQEIVMTITRLRSLAKKAPGGPQPFHWNRGKSSTSIAAALTRFQKDYASYGPFTKYIGIHGIFDVIGGGATVGTPSDTTTATYLGAYRLLVDLVAGQLGIPMYILGPHFIGEKFPSGLNASDANLDAMDSGMRIISQRYPSLITYRSNRTTFYPLEAIYNPTNLANGPFIGADSQQTHLYPSGRGVVDQFCHQQDIQLVAAPSVSREPTRYALTTPPVMSSIGYDYDPVALGLTNLAPVTSFPNGALGKFGTAFDLVTTPATKPSYVLNGIGTLPVISSAGAAWIKTAVAAVKPQPMLLAILLKPTNFASSMIWQDGFVDGGGAQQPYIATLTTGPGKVEIHGGVALDSDIGISANQWHTVIAYFSNTTGSNASSFLVIDGRMCPLGDAGLNGITGITLLAGASAVLIATGSIARATGWFSSLGPLPRWQDVQGWMTAAYGVTPQ